MCKRNKEGICKDREKSRLKKLESKKTMTLKLREIEWRMKYKVVWLGKGDGNTFIPIIIPIMERGSILYGK